MYWISFFLGTMLAAQGGLQLVDRKPQPELAPGPTYTASFAAAVASAKEKQQLALLYFTASW